MKNSVLCFKACPYKVCKIAWPVLSAAAQVLWTVHSGNPGVATSTSKVFVWNKTAVGYAAGKTPANLAGTMSGETSIGADITWHGDRAAHFVNHAMSGNSVMIDDGGVIEGNVDDTAAIPTS